MIRKFVLVATIVSTIAFILCGCGNNATTTESVNLPWQYEIFAFRGNRIKQYNAYSYEAESDTTLRIVDMDGSTIVIDADRFEIVEHIDLNKNE